MSRISAPRGSFGYAQDRLFDSAPSAVPRDKSVRRFAQDDDFVGGLKKNTPNRLTLVGLSSWAKFKRPFGTKVEFSHTLSIARAATTCTPIRNSGRTSCGMVIHIIL